jgi:predicted NUDIX family phosphoesterase
MAAEKRIEMRFVLAEGPNDCYAFVERDWAENDPTWRQIIPYVAIQDEERRIALFQRKNGSEKRLQDLFTIGVGGHIDASDIPEHHTGKRGKINDFLRDICADAMRRELWEEVKWVPERVSEVVFVIESSETAVDSVHKGLCCLAEWNFPHDSGYALPDYPEGSGPETAEEQLRYIMGKDTNMEMEFVGFKKLDELANYNLESWSQKFLAALMERK